MNLNLIERLWKFLRKEIINTKFYRTKNEFRDAVLKSFDNIASYRTRVGVASNSQLPRTQFAIHFWLTIQGRWEAVIRQEGGEKNRTSSHKQMHRCLNVLSHTPFLLLSFLPIRLIHTIHYSAENFLLPNPKRGSEGRKETHQRALNSPYRHSKKMTPKRNEEGM